MSEMEIIGYYHNHGHKVPIAAPDYEWMKAQEDLILCSICGNLCKTRYEEVDCSDAMLGEPSSDDHQLYAEAYERAVITLEDGTYKCIICGHAWNPHSSTPSTRK